MATPDTKAKAKYNAKAYDRLYLYLPKGQKEIIKAKAERKKLSINAYIAQLIENDK